MTSCRWIFKSELFLQPHVRVQYTELWWLMLIRSFVFLLISSEVVICVFDKAVLWWAPCRRPIWSFAVQKGTWDHRGQILKHGRGVHMAKVYTNRKGLHMEQRVVHKIPGHALRTNPYYTDRVGIYTEVGKQRWIWRGVTHGERLHTERGYIRRRFRLEKTHREGLHTEGGHGTGKRKTHGGSYKGLPCNHRWSTAVYTLYCPLVQSFQCTTICV